MNREPTTKGKEETTRGLIAPPTASEGGSQPSSPARPSGTSVQPPGKYAALKSEKGNTRIADGVVAKIAGLATREIPGVQDMGKGISRALGGLRARVPGVAPDDSMASRGVSVEVGEREAAVDLDIVTYYGQSIVEVTEAVRRNVIERIESMTGLEVTEVNIMVDDLFVEGQGEVQEPRVQ